MSLDAGLREAAAMARHQARVVRNEAAKAAARGDAREEAWLLLQARTAEELADTYETTAEQEKTDPRALIVHECPNCGQVVPAAWTPPAG